MAGLKASEDSILALGSKMFWGPDAKVDSFEVLVGEVSQKLGGLPTGFVKTLVMDIQPYIACVAGVLGNLEEIENSGLSEHDVESEDLNSGLTFFRVSPECSSWEAKPCRCQRRLMPVLFNER
jgi:hypothetical protein